MSTTRASALTHNRMSWEAITPSLGRHYVSSTTMVYPRPGMPQTAQAATRYIVSGRYDNAIESLPLPSRRADKMLQEFVQYKAVQEGLQARASSMVGNRAYSADLTYADLSAVVYRLAQGCAHFSAFGSLTCDELKGDTKALRVAPKDRASSKDSKDSLKDNLVYVANVTNGSEDHPAAMVALFCAIHASGSRSITDKMPVDAKNRPTYTAFSDSTLAQGCLHALRVLASQFNMADAGSLWAMAVTAGIHSILTVSAHSDEGGYLRAVLRRNTFAEPYGGIDLSLPACDDVASVATGSPNCFAEWCDNIALYTAGLSALCDPCPVTSGSKPLPTILACDGEDSGYNSPKGTEQMARTHSAQLARVCDRFCAAYASSLCRTFGLKPPVGDWDPAASWLESCFVSLSGADDRYLRHAVIAPFYWIEPTSLVGTEVSGLKAQRSGLGAYALLEQPYDHPPLEEDLELPPASSSFAHNRVINWTCARRNALINFLRCLPNDGCRFILVRRVFAHQVVLRGGEGYSIDQLAGASLGINYFLWGRGHCDFVHPAEFSCLQAGLGIEIATVELTADGTYPFHAATVAPRPYDLSVPIRYITSRPSRVHSAALVDSPAPRGILRARNDASRQLVGGRSKRVSGKIVNTAMLPVCAAGLLDPVASGNDGSGAAGGQGSNPRDAMVKFKRERLLPVLRIMAPPRVVSGRPPRKEDSHVSSAFFMMDGGALESKRSKVPTGATIKKAQVPDPFIEPPEPHGPGLLRSGPSPIAVLTPSHGDGGTGSCQSESARLSRPSDTASGFGLSRHPSKYYGSDFVLRTPTFTSLRRYARSMGQLDDASLSFFIAYAASDVEPGGLGMLKFVNDADGIPTGAEGFVEQWESEHGDIDRVAIRELLVLLGMA